MSAVAGRRATEDDSEIGCVHFKLRTCSGAPAQARGADRVRAAAQPGWLSY